MKIKKMIVLILLVIVVTSIFTGCGIAAAEVDMDTEAANGTATKNKILAIWEDKCTSMGNDVGEGFATTSVNMTSTAARGYYGTAIKPNFTFFIRDIAKVMYGSIFGTNYPYTDSFAFQPQLLNLSLYPPKLIKEVTEATTQSFATGKSAAKSALDGLRAVAAGVLISVWFMGFISQIVNEKFTMETLLKTLMQLMCGVVLILKGELLAEAFMKIAEEMMSTSASPTTGFNSFQAEIGKYLSGNNILAAGLGIKFLDLFGFGFVFFLDHGSLFAIALMIAPLWGQLQCAIKIVSMLIMRWLELVVRVTLAPVVFAFGAQTGFSQDAIRYIRGTFACALQPVFMMIGAAMFSEIGNVAARLFGKTSVSGLTGIMASVAMCAVYIIFNTYIGETKRLAQEIVAR
jgi:hypothetical protein